MKQQRIDALGGVEDAAQREIQVELVERALQRNALADFPAALLGQPAVDNAAGTRLLPCG